MLPEEMTDPYSRAIGELILCLHEMDDTQRQDTMRMYDQWARYQDRMEWNVLYRHRVRELTMIYLDAEVLSELQDREEFLKEQKEKLIRYQERHRDG